MGDKVYKPIIKDGDHLIRSKDNPNRVRGLTRDENNKNPDIIEWDELDVDDLKNDISSYPLGMIEILQQLGEELAMAVMAGATAGIAMKKGVPWVKENLVPRIKEKGACIKKKISSLNNYTFTIGKKRKKKAYRHVDNKREKVSQSSYAEVSSQIDNIFEQICFDMDEQEAQTHIMKLTYYILGAANEIRIMSNARIRQKCKSEQLSIESQRESEKLLSEKVAFKLDQLLSNENLKLDFDTSQELFSLTGGGIRRNGEYIPVQVEKIAASLKNSGIERNA